MVNVLLAFLLPILSSQSMPNRTEIPTQQPLVSQIGPYPVGNIRNEEISLGETSVRTIPIYDYFHEPNGRGLALVDIRPLGGGSLEDYPWLHLWKGDSTLLMEPKEKKDKGYYHLWILVRNSIGKNASQSMTIHVIDEAKKVNITTTSCNGEWYTWGPSTVITGGAVSAYLWKLLIDMKRKRREAIAANVFKNYVKGASLEKVIANIGKGDDAYYFKSCGRTCCKIPWNDIREIKKSVVVNLYFMLEETSSWKAMPYNIHNLAIKQIFSSVTGLSEATLDRLAEMTVSDRINQRGKIEEAYFPWLSEIKRSKKRNHTHNL